MAKPQSEIKSSKAEQAGASIPAAAVREQLGRILADPLFSNSSRYSKLLEYIVDNTLKGKHQDLRERIIGVEVFHRPADYDTSTDPTVRVAASEVRKRLALYYKEPGREHELRIEVPTRGYIAEFRMPEQNPAVQASSEKKQRKLWLIGVPAAAVIVALIAWLLVVKFSPEAVVSRFWAPVLEGSKRVLICISSPPRSTTEGVQNSAPNGSSGKAPVRLFDFLRSRGDVALNDVTAASELSSFLHRKGRDAFVQAARNTVLAELRENSPVLLGSFNNNWTIQLGADWRFQFQRESEIGLRWIADVREPANKKWAVDLSAPFNRVELDYVLISRLQDSTTGRWLISVAGLTGVGTQIGCKVLTDPQTLAPLVKNFPEGWESKNLQFVLAVKIIDGSPGASNVVAIHTW